MTSLTVFKQSALAKPDRTVMDLATRLERARQRRNERIVRADSIYVEECRAAIDALSTNTATAVATEAATATAEVGQA